MAKRGDCCWRQQSHRTPSAGLQGGALTAPGLGRIPGATAFCASISRRLPGPGARAFHSMAPARDAGALDSQHPAEQRGRRVRTGLCRPRGAAELKLALGLHLGLWHVVQPDELRAPGSASAITPSSPRCPEALPPACPSLALQQPCGDSPVPAVPGLGLYPCPRPCPWLQRPGSTELLAQHCSTGSCHSTRG